MGWPQVARLQIGGALIDGTSEDETWSCSLHLCTFSGGEPQWLEDIQPLLDDIRDSLTEWWDSGDAHTTDKASFDFVKLNNINADGHYNENVTYEASTGTTSLGQQSQAVPNFLSVAWTWETNQARGIGHRGRMYPPNGVFQFTGSRVNDAAMDQVLSSGRTFLRAIWLNPASVGGIVPRGNGGRLLQPVVASPGTPRNGNSGVAVPIVAVSADNIYDVQRRRKNQANKTRSGPLAIL